MGTPSEFAAEKLVVAILLSATAARDDVISALSRAFGPVDFQSSEIPFGFTEYYAREMGGGLRRMFVSFGSLVSPDRLASLKLATNAMEQKSAEGGDRRINLDPGLLCLSRFVLATTKESSHRIPLSSGIYAEVTLVFQRGTFRPVEWTYPDYRSPLAIDALNEIRRLYKEQLPGATHN